MGTSLELCERPRADGTEREADVAAGLVVSDALLVPCVKSITSLLVDGRAAGLLPLARNCWTCSFIIRSK